MLSGLKFLHDDSRKIIHRDLKPSNFMVMENDGRPVVCIGDFGLSVEDKDKTAKSKSPSKGAQPCRDQATQRRLKVKNRERASTSRNQQNVRVLHEEAANEDSQRRRQHAGDAPNDGEENERKKVDARHKTKNSIKELPNKRTEREMGTKYYKAPEIVSFT